MSFPEGVFGFGAEPVAILLAGFTVPFPNNMIGLVHGTPLAFLISPMVPMT